MTTKKLILFILLFTYSSISKAYECPSYFYNSKQAQKMHSWLKFISLQTEVNDCQVEVITCEDTINGGSKGNEPIGEILIITKRGYEGYLQVRFTDNKLKPQLSETNFKWGRGYFNYDYWDFVDEKYNGKIQKWDFNMYLNPKTQKIERLTLGIYSHNRRLEQDNGNNSRWFSCLPRENN